VEVRHGRDHTRFRGRYLQLTSYKRDGTAVATPVWFVEDGGKLLVQTDLGSGKVKRIRANPAVTVALCNGTGHLRGEHVLGRAELADADGTRRIEGLVKRKYRWDLLIIGPLRWAQGTFHLGKDRGPTVGVVITPRPRLYS
jgi:PPOX class probable F420-dependent enzyme